MGDVDTSSAMTSAVIVPSSNASEEASVSSAGNQNQALSPPQVVPPKKKHPDAEVIALSPTTLLATNRFVCEICNKGFQRDQNLQLHRRGHNLPWKLRQRNGKEVKKRVYVCPEVSCVHHDPSRALGDLTGIKKHFCRKHGEKKWKCERCSKKYAVMSDWKAHMKTCGTREYRCDCGTLFSRRDSFITHRAFCDALAQETAKSQTPISNEERNNPKAEKVTTSSLSSSPPPPPLTPSTGVLSPVLSVQSSELPENQPSRSQPEPVTPTVSNTTMVAPGVGNSPSSSSGVNVNSTSGAFASLFGTSSSAGLSLSSQSPPSLSSLFCGMGGPERLAVAEPISLSLSPSLYLSNHTSSLFPTSPQDHQRQYATSPQPAALSATALLQKAAQIGATSTSSSFLRGLGLAMPVSPDFQGNSTPSSTSTITSLARPSMRNPAMSHVKYENIPIAPGLGLGLPYDHSVSGLNDQIMMRPPAMFGGRPTTLDFLGIGIGPGDTPSTDGISAYLTSISGSSAAAPSSLGGVHLAGGHWDESNDRKPSFL
ncbi:OLC1v1017938C4 [Oldenlandia corymbosa var. corymbosa]|uniref:OLC1v1017938C4 n=1 Tax=Oldenlandia corymbosa var. corymbosa TaxID=529605 RepID=A0AAV1EAQ4_OLDCO|nr:OLC1v1017938C4 [Oldenlandia corymbosa var. corymbosa]